MLKALNGLLGVVPPELYFSYDMWRLLALGPVAVDVNVKGAVPFLENIVTCVGLRLLAGGRRSMKAPKR